MKGSGYKISIYWFLFGIGIGLIVASIMNFQKQIFISYLIPLDLYDETLIPVIEKVSDYVPQNETLVVSNLYPEIKYFTKHNVNFPWSAYSEKSLLQFMKDNNYFYILIVEGGYTPVESLQGLFSSEGIKKMDIDFRELVTYHTKYSNIHIYHRIA